MHVIKLDEKKAMNLKESKEGYKQRFGGKEREMM